MGFSKCNRKVWCDEMHLFFIHCLKYCSTHRLVSAIFLMLTERKRVKEEKGGRQGRRGRREERERRLPAFTVLHSMSLSL